MLSLIDCNSFYCSCERLFQPALDNQPVVVLSNNDGCVISRSDEAKSLGIKMGVPYFQCKELIKENKVAVFSSNYALYGDLSMRVMDTLRRLGGPENVEVYSIDEAFLHLPGLTGEEYQKLAQQLKTTVETWTGIKVSVGIAPTKVLCKVANRLAKNSARKGIMVLDNNTDIRSALQQTEVGDIWGIGYRYAEKLRSLGIDTALKFSTMPPEWVRKNIGGVFGLRLLKELLGEPCISMKDQLEKKKMIGTSRMFGKPVYGLEDIKEAVATYLSRAAEKLRRQQSAAGFLEVYLVCAENKNFTYHPRRKSLGIRLPAPTLLTHELISYAMPLVNSLFEAGPKYLKAGINLGELVPESIIQSSLFNHPNKGRPGKFISEQFISEQFISDRSGTLPGQLGTLHSQPGTQTGQPGTLPDQQGTLPGQPGTSPEQLATLPNQGRTLPDQLGALPDHKTTAQANIGTGQDQTKTIQARSKAGPGKAAQKQLMQALDNINFSQRNDMVKFAASGTTRNWKMRQELRSPRYTTRWNELFEVK